MTSVNVKGNSDMETFRTYLTWCVDTLSDDKWSAQVAPFTAVNIREGTYAADVFTFDNEEDAVAFKLKFEL